MVYHHILVYFNSIRVWVQCGQRYFVKWFGNVGWTKQAVGKTIFFLNVPKKRAVIDYTVISLLCPIGFCQGCKMNILIFEEEIQLLPC